MIHGHVKQLASSVKKEVIKPVVAKEPEVERVLTESEVKRRRYTAFMSDLENAILYSLSHEVGSRNSIVGPSLDTLREYVDILDKVLPMYLLTQLSYAEIVFDRELTKTVPISYYVVLCLITFSKILLIIYLN